MKILKYTFLLSAVVFILLQINYYPQMPDKVAVHFNVHGQVNGWMPKNTNLISGCIIIAIITLSISGIPYLIKNMLDNLISLPNKEYWFNGDNKERLIEILSKDLYSIGLAINFFMIFIFHQLYRFNMHEINSVSIIGLVPLLIIIFGFTIHLLIRLNKAA